MDFVALDVETANTDVSSICQIGLAGFEGGTLIREWEALIDPQTPFNYYFTTQIHGLDAAKVRGAPILPEVAATLRAWLTGQVVVCHTLFDQRALNGALAKYGLPELNCRWLDSCQVARRVWAGESPGGYNLAAICGLIGHEFQHHNALEDAKAAGAVVLAAGQKTGLTMDDWLKGKQSSDIIT